MTSRRSRRTRARALVAAAVVLAVSTTAACSSAQSGAATNSTLTVVTVNPFTGQDGPFGPEQAAGCQAAATAINAAGGVLTHTVACTSADTLGNPADAVTAAANMLATTSRLFGVLGPSSDEADSTAPLLDAANIPMFADTGEGSFDHTNLQYFWRMTAADDAQGDAMALYAHRKGYLRGAAVFADNVGSQTSVPTLRKAYRALGGTMVLNQKITLGKTSYLPEVEQLIAAHPQVIFTEASPQANAILFAELQQQGHLIPIIGTDGTTQPQWLTAVTDAIGKPALSQHFVAVQPYAAPSGAAWQVYNKNLLASASVSKPAQWSTDSYTMTAYDGVIVMALAATLTKSTDPAVFNTDVMAVTEPGPHKQPVTSFAAGKAALAAGKQIQYVGAAGTILFHQWHNANGGFGIVAYQTNGNLNLVASITAADLAPLIK
ncbi:MAG TPA: ABC transporter substrate-binding protein [Streptosporangiaceae bacterium]